MSWGALYFYYRCPNCGRKFKYAEDLIPYFGNDFGLCPDCRIQGTYIKDGPRGLDDNEYVEVED